MSQPIQARIYSPAIGILKQLYPDLPWSRRIIAAARDAKKHREFSERAIEEIIKNYEEK